MRGINGIFSVMKTKGYSKFRSLKRGEDANRMDSLFECTFFFGRALSPHDNFQFKESS